MRNQELRNRNDLLNRKVKEMRRSHEEQKVKLADLERQMEALAVSSIE